MPSVIPGRFTARTDDPFVVFMIGMWLPLHKDPAVVGSGLTRAKSTRGTQNVPTVQPD